MTRGFFNGHQISEHMSSGRRWFTVDDRDFPRFDTCAEAADWIRAHLSAPDNDRKAG